MINWVWYKDVYTPKQGRMKQFDSGQAISQKEGSGGPPLKNVGKKLMLHFGTI